MGYEEVVRIRGRLKLGRVILYSILILLAASWLLPYYVIISSSFKSLRELSLRKFLEPPLNPDLKPYIKALKEVGPGLINSTLISTISTLLSVLIGAWGGYFLARFRFKYAVPLFFLIAVATYLPPQIMLIPSVQLMAKLNLYDTYQGLIFMYTILYSPMAALIIATFFLAIPNELQEAAFLDGCGPIQFFWRILIPLSMPGIASAIILIFTMIWNEFLFALTLSRSPTVRPVMPVVAALKGTTAAEWNVQMAGTVLASLPPLITFILLGRYFIRGLLAGALRG